MSGDEAYRLPGRSQCGRSWPSLRRVIACPVLPTRNKSSPRKPTRRDSLNGDSCERQTAGNPPSRRATCANVAVTFRSRWILFHPKFTRTRTPWACHPLNRSSAHCRQAQPDPRGLRLARAAHFGRASASGVWSVCDRPRVERCITRANVQRGLYSSVQRCRLRVP